MMQAGSSFSGRIEGGGLVRNHMVANCRCCAPLPQGKGFVLRFCHATLGHLFVGARALSEHFAGPPRPPLTTPFHSVGFLFAVVCREGLLS